jgi:hypothetical protein
MFIKSNLALEQYERDSDRPATSSESFPTSSSSLTS